jgi:hypothetical protein
MLRSRPADRSAELERLNDSRDALEALYGRERTLQVERARQTGAPLEGSRASEHLGRRLSELEAAITMMRQAQSQRQAWEKLNIQALAAGRLAADELASREHEALLALEQDPPQHLVAELGQPPASGAGRQIWRHGARLIEQYRTSHDVDDAKRAFGATREDPAQQAELAMLQRTLDRIVDSLHLTGSERLALPSPPHELALDQ